MSSDSIYEKRFMTECLGAMKEARNEMGGGREQAEATSLAMGLPMNLLDYGGDSYSDYSRLADLTRRLIRAAILGSVVDLLDSYGIDAEIAHVERRETCTYRTDAGLYMAKSASPCQREVLVVKLQEGKATTALYCFKDLGIAERLPRELEQQLKESTGVSSLKYVSLVEGNAYAEVINHNADADDPTRGTGTYSLEQFFEAHFEPDEYPAFKRYLDKAKEAAEQYYGVSVVMTLEPTTMPSFLKKVRSKAVSFDYMMPMRDRMPSDAALQPLKKRFIDNRLCEVLTGKAGFATSLLTAEWLYSSLGMASNIDLTSVALGYFKTIEQFLFAFISLFASDGHQTSRQLYVGKRGEREYRLYAKGPDGKTNYKEWVSVDKCGYAALTRQLISGDFSESIALGGLTGFFGYRGNSGFQRRNKDLLCKNVSDEAYEYIVDVLSDIRGLRNGYLHKDNLFDWQEVARIRDETFLALFLILGAYRLTEAELECLGLIRPITHDDYYRLCEHIHKSTFFDDPLAIPVFYLDDGEVPLLPCRDKGIVLADKYGEAQYTGAYFKNIGSKQEYDYKITSKDQVARVSEGALLISKTAPIKLALSNERRVIYEDGVFRLR